MENIPAVVSPRIVLTEEEQTLSRLLLAGQNLLVQNPQAAHALINAFVREGRRFAATPEGERIKQTLIVSDLVHRGRFIWDAYNLDAVLEVGGGQIPSAWLDVILAAVANPDLETILSNLVVEEVKHGTFGPT